MKKYNITREALEELYLDKELSTVEIAKIYGCTASNISHLLFNFDIPKRRRIGEKRNKDGQRYKNYLKIDKDELYDLYWNKGYSLKILCQEVYFCSHVTIINRMKEYGIPRREVKRPKGWTNEYVEALRNSLHGK